MKWIGHVSCAVLAAAPLVHFREHLPPELQTSLSDTELFIWAGFFAAVPDFDLLLSRFLPIRHRGYASHSLLTVLGIAGFLFGAGWALQAGWVPESLASRMAGVSRFLTPFCAVLAGLAVLSHLLGDAMTKTGVPLFLPNRMWHIPYIGGRATFDAWWLNAIPVAAAGYVLTTHFGVTLQDVRGSHRWRALFSD